MVPCRKNNLWRLYPNRVIYQKELSPNARESTTRKRARPGVTQKTFTIAIWKCQFYHLGNLHHSSTRASNEAVIAALGCPDIGQTTIRKVCASYTLLWIGHGFKFKISTTKTLKPILNIKYNTYSSMEYYSKLPLYIWMNVWYHILFQFLCSEIL